MIQPDLLAPLEPPPPEPGITPGTFRGDLEGLDAAARRVEVYCGPRDGWRPLADRIGPGCTLVMAYGRLMAGPSYGVGDAAPAMLFPPTAREQALQDAFVALRQEMEGLCAGTREACECSGNGDPAEAPPFGACEGCPLHAIPHIEGVLKRISKERADA